ncbi:hypothetical protein [uncultured Parabacteroides sp.]|nr:hypothetical protein [uncultured Parabacteroides sp.]
MKKVLKGWLIDNAVTTDNKTDNQIVITIIFPPRSRCFYPLA